MSKTVETGKPWYAGYGKEQVVHLVKDDNALKLNKTIEKFKRGGNNLKSYGAEVRLKSHRNIQLIDPLNLTARQINQNLLKDGKDSCKKRKCMEEVAAIDRTTSYYMNHLVPNLATMHGLLRGVRVLIKLFLLLGGRTEIKTTQFLYKHLAQVACAIRDADPWFIQMHDMFKEIADAFCILVENGVHKEPDFLRAVNAYSFNENSKKCNKE